MYNVQLTYNDMCKKVKQETGEGLLRTCKYFKLPHLVES